MLTTKNCEFRVNRDGTLDIYPKPGFTFSELARVMRMAVLHARRKKIKKPTKFNRWW